MGLSVTLHNALTGLNVNQQQLSVLSQNIANANTQGYSKQVAQQDSVYLDGQGQGVSIAEITRKIDDYLTQAVQRQGSILSSTEVLNDFSTRIQLLMGNPGNRNSIDSYINTFYNTVQSLSQTPQNTTLQQTAVNAGVSLADQVSDLAASLRDLQFQADQDIAVAVGSVNVSLKRVAELNELIAGNVSLGKSVAELEDRRDNTVREIGKYINISTFTQSNGNLSATTGNGVTILDNSAYRLLYNPVASAASFSDGSSLGAITIARIGDNGVASGVPVTLANAGVPENIASVFTSGAIAGLMEMRDRQIPSIIAQLDTMASVLRDQFNAVHNAGSGYPGANSLTGTRPLFAQQINQWAGQARIAVLDSNGQPVTSPYADESHGYAPLTLNLEKMDSLSGVGNPSVQSIIDAINQYYGVPQNKMQLSNLNNIQMVSDSESLPSTPPKFNFDFNLNNISGSAASFFVTNIAVKNNNGVDITSVTSTIPTVSLDPATTYITSAGSSAVTISTAGTHSLSNGQTVFLSTPPGGPYDGIPAASLGGYFTVRNVSANTFEIDVGTAAQAGTTSGVAGMTARPPYAQASPGGDTRSRDSGVISADLTADPASPFYTISVSIGVDNGSGVIQTSVVSYRVNNQQPNALNKIIGVESMTGSGRIVIPTTTRPLAVAMLVDAQGKELPKVNGAYTNQESGYLKIIAGTSDSTIAIDSLDSRELGNPTVSPIIPGSNRGFSHYFNLNDFFVSNAPINTGDTTPGSAMNMAVSAHLRNDPSLFSLGRMIRSPNASNPMAPPNYTYQLNPGDNSIVTRLSVLSSTTFAFSAAGGLGATTQTFSGYTGQIIGSAATNAVTAKTNFTNASALLDGYNENASAISGVNLDAELANTIIYQNAYSASARVITVANQLFEVLLNSFQ